MNRLDIIQHLLLAHRASAIATSSFLEKPRRYVEDDNLFMREVHFVMEVGVGENLTMGELAQRLNVTQGAVTQMATKMEKKGYVLRTKDSRDKRLTTISLTEKGKQLWKSHAEYDRQQHMILSEILKDFSDEELTKIIHYENTLRELFTNHLYDFC